jgi:outer membrane protein OmpA-like peptidoglycan-associated protein
MQYLLCGVLWLSFFTLCSQNLVPNPGFEEYVKCPGSYMLNRNEFAIHGWQSPTSGTPDHFHSCSTGEADVPVNWAGNSNAHTGKGYAGIYVWTTGRDYREYLECELAEPLVAGEKYVLEFYYKLASNTVYATNRMGLALSQSRVTETRDDVLGITPVLSVEKDTAMTAATGSWEQARMEYMAQGGERYVIIGNFFSNAQTRFTRLPFRYGLNPMLNDKAYYYIDDVLVQRVGSVEPVSSAVVAQLNPEAIELNHRYTLKDIKFEFNSYILHPASNDELAKVVAYLKAHPEVNVRVSGHTDFAGSDEYNLVLSRNRAKSVADFLIMRGIAEHRIVSYGFGKSRPLSSEITEAAATLNRRVELRFVPKE